MFSTIALREQTSAQLSQVERSTDTCRGHMTILGVVPVRTADPAYRTRTSPRTVSGIQLLWSGTAAGG